MCGRYQLSRSPEEIAKWFGTKNPVPNYPARYNIAPTDPVLAVRFNRKTGERTLDHLHWGLIPHWAKDLKIGARTINARAESLPTTASFRDAFESRRCLVPTVAFTSGRRRVARRCVMPSCRETSRCSPSPDSGK